MTFQKAVKHEAKLRLAIAGPSGSGKTYTALAIATVLANGGKIAMVDTEHGSASKYADLFSFDVLEMTAPFHPDRFGAAITDAAQAGYSVLILDSLTHAWNGPGGLLEIVDGIAARMRTTNTFAAWKDATPIQNRLIEAIVAAPIHIIATMRSKQDYVQSVDDRGKTVIRKVGMAPQQREGFEYEFDVFMDMDIDNTGIIQKTRCPDLTGGVYKKPGADVAGILIRWLHGAPGEPRQPQPQPTTTTTTNGTNGKPALRPGEKVWADWTGADDAKAWAVTQRKFNHDKHLANAYEKVRANVVANGSKKADDMWQAWWQYVTDHEPQEARWPELDTDQELDDLFGAGLAGTDQA